MLESLFNEVAASGLELYQRETPTKVFTCEYCEIFKNSFFFTEHPSGCFCKDFFQGILRNSKNYYLLVRQLMTIFVLNMF